MRWPGRRCTRRTSTAICFHAAGGGGVVAVLHDAEAHPAAGELDRGSRRARRRSRGRRPRPRIAGSTASRRRHRATIADISSSDVVIAVARSTSSPTCTAQRYTRCVDVVAAARRRARSPSRRTSARIARPGRRRRRAACRTASASPSSPVNGRSSAWFGTPRSSSGAAHQLPAPPVVERTVHQHHCRHAATLSRDADPLQLVRAPRPRPRCRRRTTGCSTPTATPRSRR